MLPQSAPTVNQVVLVPISEISTGTRYRDDVGDLTELVESIKRLGLLQPIGLTPSKSLIWGERRLWACKKLGWKTIPARLFDLDSLSKLEAERDENDDAIRKSLTNEEKLAICEAIKTQIGERRGRPVVAPEPTQVQQGKPGADNVRPTAHIPQKGERTDAHVAKKGGFESPQEMRRAKAVKELCSRDVRDAVDDKTVSLSDAAAVANETHDVQDAALQLVVYGKASTLKKAVEVTQAERNGSAATKAVVRDVFGQVVPEHLHRHADSTQFQVIQDKAKELRFLLNALDKDHPASSHRQVGQGQAYCKAIEQAMIAERFGYVCPVCLGQSAVEKTAPCECCFGKLWFVAGDKDKIDLKRFGLKRPA